MRFIKTLLNQAQLMNHKIISIITLSLSTIILFATATHASANKKFGLAMHGEPALTENSAHFPYAKPDAPKGGKLIRAATGSFNTLVPYTIKGSSASGLGLITDSLMARSWDEPFTMYPLIAKSYDIATDRSWISFTLDPRARFHDGSQITTDDVLFSFKTLKASGRPNMRSIYKIVNNVEIPHKNTIKFTFGKGYDQETALILSMMPILSKSYWSDKEFDKTTLVPPLTNGAYKIKNLDAGRSITYERVKDYWAAKTISQTGMHNFDEVTFQYFRDQGVALEAFKAGEISIRHEPSISRWANSYNIPAVKSKDIIMQSIAHQRPEKAKGLIFNARRAPFNNIKLRQALALLFDGDWISKNIYYGEYQRINSYYPNSELSASAEIKSSLTPRQKKREAYKLLKEAGWIIKNGKAIHNQTSEHLSFEILLSAPEEEKIALTFKNTLQKAGIDVKIHVMDSAAYRARMNDYDFDMTIYHWQSSLSPGTEQLLYFSCKAANEPARWNFPGICAPEIDALAGAIAQSKTRKELISITRKLDKKLMDGVYMIPLFFQGADNYVYWKPISHPAKSSLYGAVIESWWMDHIAKK